MYELNSARSTSLLGKKLNEIDTIIHKIDTNLRMGFSSLHDFDRNRVTTMRSVVRRVSFSEVSQNYSEGVATMFTAFYRGKLVPPHFNCNGPSPYPHDIIVHDKLDLAIITLCPEAGQTKAINITEALDIRLGDDVILYGHGKRASLEWSFVGLL